MIVDQGTDVLSGDRTRFAWSGLRRYSNSLAVKKRIVDRWLLSKRHHSNAEKQALQLGFCLAQAKEYFEAAERSTLATQPMQLYYGCMSLALSEILWKGGGMMSLDKLRQKHAHHGLELKLGNLKN
jgi:hypothetical protein